MKNICHSESKFNSETSAGKLHRVAWMDLDCWGDLKPYKVVWTDDLYATSYCVRTDTYPVLWAWFWVLFRLWESIKVIDVAGDSLGVVWGFWECEKRCSRSVARRIWKLIKQIRIGLG